MRRLGRWRPRPERAPEGPPRDTALGDGAANGDAAAHRYTVDELAHATGVPSRTIRFYQFKGVLPRPARHGRVALYDGRHVAGLRLIGDLQDRGLSLRAVRHVLRQDSGDARLLKSCLGFGEDLGKPWSEDRPATLGHDELVRIVGDEQPGLIASLVELGVVRRDDAVAPAAYRIRSPGLFRTTLALRQSGVEVETAVRAGDILRRHLARAARQLVEHFTRRAGRGFGRSAAPGAISAALDGLRPLAGDAARLIFAQEIERVLRKRVAGGRAGRSTDGSRRKGRGR